MVIFQFSKGIIVTDNPDFFGKIICQEALQIFDNNKDGLCSKTLSDLPLFRYIQTTLAS
jgi:hypothetical protein